MNLPPAAIGAALADIETPALVIDLDAFDRNIAKMADFARTAGVRVRPHAKTHKCAAIARRQIAAGAVGQCVQKVGEAEALVRGGVTDVQMELMQFCPSPQALPHVPQLALLLVRSASQPFALLPSQSPNPALHEVRMHVPAAQRALT